MALTRLERRPDKRLYIEPNPNDTLQKLPAPHIQLFEGQFDIWAAVFQKADRRGEAVLRRTAQDFREQFRSAVEGRKIVEAMRLKFRPYNVKYIGDWYLQSVNAFALSALCQELGWTDQASQPMAEADFALNRFMPNMILDFDSHRPQLGGLHLSAEAVEELDGVDWPPTAAPIWYEGEQIFVRVRTPALPTDSFVHNYDRNWPDAPFQPDEFVSLMPRVKNSVWTGEAK